ncbi:MAG TPA: ABC transporter ATP-binding protein [Candidatus Acidoferrales bacterium]|nr:ABC transporter ATP-binding protein [Candidatus Acidoferrales bacterium]
MSTSPKPVPAPGKKAGPTEPLWKALPDAIRMLRPNPGLIVGGFLLMIVNRVMSLVLPFTTRYLVDDVLVPHNAKLLGPIALAVVAATLIQGLTAYSLSQLISKAAQRMVTQLRQRVQTHIGRLSVSYFDSNKTGQLVSRIMSDVEGVRNLIGTGMIDFFGSLLTGVLAFGVLVYYSRLLTVIAFTVILFFGLGLRKAFAVIRPLFRARPKIYAEVTGRLTESLGGVRVIKGYNAEGREEGVFAAGVGRLLDNVLKSITAMSLMSLSSTVLFGIVSALVMYFGGKQVVASHMTSGMLLSYFVFLGFLIAPALQVVNIGTQVNEALAGLERTRDVLKEAREESDPHRRTEIGPIVGTVEFENVGFAYDPGKPVLFDNSFRADPGTVTALVGPSGAGKSTIIGLIASFYTPTSGVIRVDGLDLATVKLSTYRTQLGVVLQETFLFDGTIRENVAFSRPDATEDEILTACRIARVDEFAETFEKKYDTIIGERGVKLSGGQRQRLSIARAILANPRILILDEATSSLDSESEAMIQEGLSFLMRGRTTFVIAHRLSTIRRADQILVIEGGRIVERGTHASLYEARGRYFEMYTKQHGLEENLFLAPGECPAEAEDAPGRRVGGGNGPAMPDAMRIIRGQET